jgi:NAD(P)-dependent dehydrogenase (short-subunit alcohol dehydrogenase family)
VFEVNVLGTRLCCEAALAAGVQRIVITGSGASYLPGNSDLSYGPSKAAVGRYAENLNNSLEGRVPVFLFSPGLVRTDLTSWLGDDAPWTPPELAPELVRKLATGRYDTLAGLYIHAEHDDVDDLLARSEEIREQDLNAIRLRRR